MARALRLLLVSLLLLAAHGGCGGGFGASEVDDDPVATVRSFLELMDRSSSDERALAEAHALLDRRARKALQARADRARALSGRSFEPWQMLTQGRFRLRFVPVSPGGLRARVEGQRAVVVASGAQPGERAEIPLVREDDGWRIELALPALRSEPIPEPPPSRQAAP